MRDYSINYRLTEEQEARLMALTVRYNRALSLPDGAAISMEGLLSSLMLVGSARLIDERMNGISAALEAMERGNARGDGSER